MRNLPGVGKKECESRPYGIRDVALKRWLVHGVVRREVGGLGFGGFWFCVRLVNPVAVRAPPGLEGGTNYEDSTYRAFCT